MQKTVKTLLMPLLFLWLFIVIIFFYWGHQYILVPAVIGTIRTAWLLLVFTLIGLAALGLGVLTSRLLRLRYNSRFEEVVYSLGLGLGWMSLISLALGIAGLIMSTIFWVMTLVLAVITSVWLIRERQMNTYPPHPNVEPLQRFDYLLLVFIALVLLIGLLLALTPPIAWDGLSIHLVLVRDILRDGMLRPAPNTARPIVGHLLFVWGMALGGESLPQLLSYGQGLLMVTAVAMFSRQFFGRRTAILTAAFLCSVEVFIINATWPYLDVPTGLYALLAILTLVNWQLGQRAGRPWLIISVVFAVFAAHTKLNGLFVYPAIATGIALGLWWQRKKLRSRIVDVGLALVAGVLIASIWTLIENTLRTEASNAVAQISDAAMATAGNLGGAENLFAKIASYFIVIWEMTIVGQQGGLRYDGTISPFFLILIPLLLFLPRKPRVIWALLVAALVEFVSWLLVPKGYYQNRHLILAYPLFSILAAYFVSRLPELDRKSFSVSGFFKIAIALVLFLQLLSLISWYQALNPAAYLLGLETREQYLSEKLNGGISPGYYTMMQTMNQELPRDSVVGVVWPEPRVYYCQMDCIRYPFPRSAGLEQMTEITRDLDLTHLLISERGLEYWLEYSQDDLSTNQQVADYRSSLDAFVAQFGELEHNQDDSFYLYRLRLID